MFKTILNRGWCPTIITAIAVVGLIYEWPIEFVAPPLIVLLLIGLVITIIRIKKNELELLSMRLTQLSAYFNRRFMGNSSLSVFATIDSLYSVDNPKVWDWARACGMAQRIFDTWANNFTTRVESDLRSRRYTVFLHTHLNELWSINSHYYEFTEQFAEIVEKFEVPREIVIQYNRFVVEYNAFIQSFRDIITELRNVARTQIEAPSVKFARELPEIS
ncbi:hypothetical protein ACFLWU_04065 [Chloroflexota bacterium]